MNRFCGYRRMNGSAAAPFAIPMAAVVCSLPSSWVLFVHSSFCVPSEIATTLPASAPLVGCVRKYRMAGFVVHATVLWSIHNQVKTPASKELFLMSDSFSVHATASDG